MRNKILESISSGVGQVRLLGAPNEITEKMLEEDEILLEFANAYLRATKTIEKIILSITLSIYQNQRRVIALSRKSIRAIYENDPNWETSVSYSDNEYGKICAALGNSGIERFSTSSGGNAGMFIVKEDSLWGHLVSSDFNEQFREIWEFVKPTKLSIKLPKYLEHFPDLITELEKQEILPKKENHRK